MSQTRRRIVGAAALVAMVALLPAMAMAAQPPIPRLLVMDLPYARVWEGAIRALGGYTLARASEGVIETARAERAPLPAEAGVDRIAERVTVRVEAVGDRVTRITVTVDAEALRGGSWHAVEASPATARAVLDRIRAAIG